MAEATLRVTALRSGVRLELFTVIWMAAEATLAIGAGIAARSVLLTAFGADSVIELISGATLLWRLHLESRGEPDDRVDAVEKQATWISAILLVLLCIYVVASSAAGLVLRIQPERSWLGIAVSAVALLVMPWLAARKKRVNSTIQSPALRADIVESASCAFLAAVTLVGVGMDALTGWWWLEYLAALLLLRWLVPEAREAVEAARAGTTRCEHA